MPSYTDFVLDDSGYQRPVAGATVYLFDEAGTAAADPVTTDGFGRYTFNNVADNFYRVEARLGGVVVASGPITIGTPPQARGPAGPADNTYTSYTALQASDPSRRSARLVGDTDSSPRPDATYSNPTQTAGGWIVQTAAGISFGANTAADALPNVYNIPRAFANAVVQNDGTIAAGTDCATEFNRLKALGVAAGKPFSVVFPAGSFITYSSLALADNMTVILNDATVFGLPPVPTGGLGHQKLSVFTIAGSEVGSPQNGTGDYMETTPRPLADNTLIPTDSQQIPAGNAANVADLSPGDWVYMGQGWGYWHAVTSEYVQVASVTGTTVTFRTPLRYTYSNQSGSLADFIQRYKLSKPAPAVGSMKNWPIAGFRKVIPRRNAHIVGTGNSKIVNLRPTTSGYGVFAVMGWCAIGCSVTNVSIGGGQKWWLDSQAILEQDVRTSARYSSTSVQPANENAWLYNGSNNLTIDRPKLYAANIDLEEAAADIRINTPLIDAGVLYPHSGVRKVLIEGNGTLVNANVALQIGSNDFDLGVQDFRASGLTITSQGSAIQAATARLLTLFPHIDPAMIPAVARYYSGSEVSLNDCEAISTGAIGAEVGLAQPIRARNLRVGRGQNSNVTAIGGGAMSVMGTARRGYDDKRVGTLSFTGDRPTVYAELDTLAYNNVKRMAVVFERRAVPLGSASNFLVVDQMSANGGVVVGDVARFLITKGAAGGEAAMQTAFQTTGGSAVVAVPATAGFVAGMAFTGENIPVGTTIQSVDGGSQITLTNPAAYSLNFGQQAQATVGYVKREYEVPVTAVNNDSSFFNFDPPLPSGFTAYTGPGAYVDFARWA